MGPGNLQKLPVIQFLLAKEGIKLACLACLRRVSETWVRKLLFANFGFGPHMP